MASENKQRGYVVGEDDSDIADYCGFECTQDYLYFLDKLRQKDMITPVEGGFKITHWEDRQYIKPSDASEATRERKRRQRERDKESGKKERSYDYLKHKATVIQEHGNKCFYCSSTKDITLDHKLPVSRGGSNDPSNLVPCCKTCNSRKKDRTSDEWISYLNTGSLEGLGVAYDKGIASHSVTGRDESVMSHHTDTDPDQITDSDPDSHSDPEVCAGEKIEQAIAPPANTHVYPIAESVTATAIHDPMGDRFSAGNALPPWRNGRNVNGLNPQFVEWLAKSYLAKLACYKDRTPGVADAQSWILKRERFESDLIEVQWQAYSQVQAQPGVDPTSSLYNWRLDPRFEEWRSQYQAIGLRFVRPDGRNRDMERNSFVVWLNEHEEAATA